MRQGKRRWTPRSVKLVPAALISVIVLAITSLLGLLNFDVDMPTISSGPAPAVKPDSEPVEPETSEPQFIAAPSEPEQQRPTESSAELVPTPELINIVIDGDTYLLQVQGDDGASRRPVTLEEAVGLASDASGDASGIKARISRTFTATARADQQLVRALREAGLTDDEIDQRRTLVE